jgi:DNA-binding FadR family transcriptional regulator
VPPAAVPERPNLYEAVQAALRAYILQNRLRPGDGLPSEAQLAQQLGVGRNSVREAVKALVSLGILETRRGSGVFVKDFSLSLLIDNLPYSLLFDLDELTELLEVRRAVENHLTARAISEMTEDTLRELREILDAMHDRIERGESILDEDRRFHRVMFRDAGNQVALKLLEAFWLTMSKAIDARVEMADESPQETYRQHEAVYAALATKDEAAVRAALDRHYEPVLRRFKRAGLA